MKIVRETAPYIRKESNVSRMMLDVLIALLPSLLVAFYKFKLEAILVYLLSVITVVATEYIFYKIVKKEYNKPKIIAGLVTATIYALILPADTSLYTVVVGLFLALLFGKLLFGGMGYNIANPAAFARVLVTISFTATLVYTQIPDAAAGATALADIMKNGIDVALSSGHYSIIDLFLGRVPGSMGEISALAIIIGGIYLFARKSADIRPTLAFISTFTILTMVAAIAGNYNILNFTLFHIFSGGMLFGAVFMVTDPVSTPVSKTGRIYFGMYAAAITVFIRLFGAYPEGVAFSILIMNMFSPTIDYYKWSQNKYNRSFYLFSGISMFMFILIIALSGGAL